MTDSRQRSIGEHLLHPESLMMSYGYDPALSEGAVKSPIFQTSTFVFRTAEEGKAFFEVAYGLREKHSGEVPGLIYSRLNNPGLEILEDRLCLWDGAESCAVFASGMAAVTTSLLAHLRPGDVVLYSAPIYGGTDHFLHHVLPGFGVEPVPMPAGVPFAPLEDELRAAIGQRRLGAVLLEAPANPTNGLVDIAAVSRFARSFDTADRRALVMVDNTLLGPIFQSPLKHGADIVLYSATKYIGGHSDVIAGAALGSAEVMKPVRGLRTFLGSMASPFTGWLLMRSLETVKIRMETSSRNAGRVADFLATHPLVEKLHWLGSMPAEDPMLPVYKAQCTGPGSLISFVISGGEPAAFRFLNALSLIKLAVSLGGTESLAEHPASMTHADVPPEEQERYGIAAGLVRISVGIEHPDDLIADLTRAFDAV